MDSQDASTLTGNYGVADAVALYVPAYHLPDVTNPGNCSGVRVGGGPPPQTVIIGGATREFADRYFSDCNVAGHITNAYGVKNEETLNHPDIFVCGGVRLP